MRALNRISVLLICCATSIATRATGQNDLTTGPFSTVTIHVVDEAGQTVACRIEKFYDRGHDMTSHFAGLKGTQIPYGVYAFAIKRRGLGSAEETVQGVASVWSPEKLVVVTVNQKFWPGASVDTAVPAGFLIKGQLSPVPRRQEKSEPLWVRLSPIYGRDHIDIGVDDLGEFRVYEPLTGRYLLAVIQGPETLHVQQIEFDQKGQSAAFSIRIPEAKPALVRVMPQRGNNAAKP